MPLSRPTRSGYWLTTDIRVASAPRPEIRVYRGEPRPRYALDKGRALMRVAAFCDEPGCQMSECDSCGRQYPSLLEAAMCGERDSVEAEDRAQGTVYRPDRLTSVRTDGC